MGKGKRAPGVYSCGGCGPTFYAVDCKAALSDNQAAEQQSSRSEIQVQSASKRGEVLDDLATGH